jgi:hypothetical protein
MTNRPPEKKKDLQHERRWRLWEEMRRLRQETRTRRADTATRIIGGIVLFAIIIAGFVGLIFLIKTLSRMFW